MVWMRTIGVRGSRTNPHRAVGRKAPGQQRRRVQLLRVPGPVKRNRVCVDDTAESRS